MINKKVKQQWKRYLLSLVLCVGLLYIGSQLILMESTANIITGGILVISGVVLTLYTVLSSMCK